MVEHNEAILGDLAMHSSSLLINVKISKVVARKADIAKQANNQVANEHQQIAKE